ncbi:MFS transporter [Sulfobacillus sp. hq2]|uniref:Major facilitator superfamily (MFS) profile domain-containing protein n=1 Tax=Sulfobacillus thermotolerans TaxID=338644 RepID=A0ABM6RQ27_9FIRM|nr:MFS transporter [Sulfobacillus sp. hq2]AUW93413.1 hypothetical protein BXT84_05130 [Sulfobacillus thermotolerans]MCY0906949.1 MFS transporter [Sulfobacillus thermotolerans]POB10644.1 hypothetical protein CO251_07370 [Sulfobacillus sp. hq2]
MRVRLWAVNGAGLAFNVSFLMLALLVPIDATRLGYHAWVVGLLAATPGVMQLPARILSGPLTSFFGERRLLLITFAVGASAGLCAATIDIRVVGLILAQLLIGAARGVFWTAAQSLASKLGSDPARNLGQFTSATKAGALLGIATSGSVAGIWGMPVAFGLSAFLSVVAGALAWTFPTFATAATGADFMNAVKSLGPVAKKPVVVVSGLVALLTALPQALAQSFYPIKLLSLHMSAQDATAITALQSFGMIAAGLGATILLRRWGFRPVILGSIALLGMSVALSSTGTATLVAVFLLLGGIAAGLLNVGFLSAVTMYGDASQRGLYFGVTQVYFVLAMIATPVISGLLVVKTSLSAMFLADGVFTLITGAVVWGLWSWGFRRAEPIAP